METKEETPYKYVALGCSLTGCSLTQQHGYVHYLNGTYSLDIKHISQGGGDNYLQHHRLSNLYAKNLINKDTTLLWQLTAPDRLFYLLNDDQDVEFHGLKYGEDDVEKKPDWDWMWFYHNKLKSYTEEEWSIFNRKAISIRANNQRFHYEMKFGCLTRTIYHLQETLVNIGLWSNTVKEIILYFGWDWYGEYKDEMYPQTLDFLHRYSNIKVIPLEKSILQWSIDKNITLYEDGMHPSYEGHCDWCKNVLVPYLDLYGSMYS